MTEKEFLRRVYSSSPDAREVYLNDRMIEVAKEAGATFDPEPPPEPEVVWSSEKDIDGWEERLLSDGRWQMRKVESEIDWLNQGAAAAEGPVRKKLGEMLLAERRASGSEDWVVDALNEYAPQMGRDGWANWANRMAAIIRNHAPRLKTVDETWQKIRPHGDVVTYKHWVVAALKDAGLPEGEP